MFLEVYHLILSKALDVLEFNFPFCYTGVAMTIPDTQAAAKVGPPGGLTQVEGVGVATTIGQGPPQGPPCPPVDHRPGGEGVMKVDTIRKASRSSNIASGKFRQPPGSM